MLAKRNIFKVIHCWKRFIIMSSQSSQPNLISEVHVASGLAEETKLPDILESPELPNWVKFREQNSLGLSGSEDDDFILPKIADWAEAKKLLDHTDRHSKLVVKEVVNNDINRLGKVLKGRFKSPEDVIEAISASCSDVSLSDRLVEELLKRFSNDWIPAFGFFNWIKNQSNYSPSVNSYNMMVDFLGKSRKFGLMWELIAEMGGLEGGLGIVSVVTLTKVMRRLAGAGMWEDAIQVFRDMEERFGLEKDTSSMNILMDALVKENSVEHAHAVFMEFKDTIPPVLSTFNILIHGFCKAGILGKAKEAMEEMKKQGFCPNVVSYTPFVEVYCREKNFQKVDEVLDEMEKNNCSPNVVTYTVVMHALGKAKVINKALEIYEIMKRKNCAPDAAFYSSLIFILYKSGRYKDARDVFDDMPSQNVKPDVLTYNTMISASWAHAKEEEALGLLMEMERESVGPNLETYAPLLKMCCRKKWIKVLNVLLNDMFKKGVSLDTGTYTLLVLGLCKSSKLEHACAFFEEAVLKGMTLKDSTYKLLMDKLEEKGLTKAKKQIESLMSPGKCDT